MGNNTRNSTGFGDITKLTPIVTSITLNSKSNRKKAIPKPRLEKYLNNFLEGL
jgi:hypothetical protein